MADGDPLKIEQYLKMPVWSYFVLLNRWLEQLDKDLKEAKKRKKHG
jgi:hypothetical protein